MSIFITFLTCANISQMPYYSFYEPLRIVSHQYHYHLMFNFGSRMYDYSFAVVEVSRHIDCTLCASYKMSHMHGRGARANFSFVCRYCHRAHSLFSNDDNMEVEGCTKLGRKADISKSAQTCISLL